MDTNSKPAHLALILGATLTLAFLIRLGVRLAFGEDDFWSGQLFYLLHAGSKYCIREWILFSGWIWFWEHLCLVAAYLPFISDPVGPFGKILSVDRCPAGSTRCRNGALRIPDRSARLQCIRRHLGMRNSRLLSLLRDARYRSAGNRNGHVLHCARYVATAARKQAKSQHRLVSGRRGSWRDTANSCFGGAGGGRRDNLVCDMGCRRELLGEAAEEFCRSGCGCFVTGPWLMRTYHLTGAPVFSSQTGWALWMGNNPQTFSHYPAESIDLSRDEAWLKLLETDRADLQQLPNDEIARSNSFAHRALLYVRENPLLALQGMFRKLDAAFSWRLNPFRGPTGTGGILDRIRAHRHPWNCWDVFGPRATRGDSDRYAVHSLPLRDRGLLGAPATEATSTCTGLCSRHRWWKGCGVLKSLPVC